MPCYHPIQVYREVGGLNPETGKWRITFNKADGLIPLKISCGQCVGCRLERSRKWAMRIMHEAQMHEVNSFITLTYDDEHLKYMVNLDTGELNPTLVKRDWQLFMKKLRKELTGVRIRFFMCGEYGSINKRPHFHACVFGYDFPDKKFYKLVEGGHRLYVSETLTRIWSQGICTIGGLTFQSAAYVARYILKKHTGHTADDYYQGTLPEFTLMSRMPGIGRDWIEKYYKDVYPHDFVIVGAGFKCKPHKYYDAFMEKEHNDIITDVYQQRILMIRRMPKLSEERLYDKKKVKLLQIEKLKRSI